MRFVFVHGWGFDAGFWAPLCDALGEPRCFTADLGFLGPRDINIPTSEPYIAVGHSFGVQWLLENCADHPWRALISINGFSRFTKSDDFPYGTDPRILRRMIAGFAKRPETVCHDFLKLCGVETLVVGELNTARMLDGLHALRDWDQREAFDRCAVPVLALTGGADPLASPDLNAAVFSPHTVLVKPDGNHILPLSAPSWCAERITEFLELIGMPS